MALSKKHGFHAFLAIVFVSLIGFSLTELLTVKESKTKEYYKARASRRGDIRKAKDSKKTISLHQERMGVVRQLWLDNEATGSSREFYMEASHADVIADIKPKAMTALETFQSPKGWFQEELYWEIPETKEKVFPEYNETGEFERWVYEGTEKRAVEIGLYDEISPKQRIRYFDAAKAEWNLVTNQMVAYIVSFCIVEMPGHTPTRIIDPSYVVVEGSAESMTFFFSKGDAQKGVETTGMKLTMGSRSSVLDNDSL